MVSKIHLVVLVALASSLAACSGTDGTKSKDVGTRKAQEADNSARNVRDKDGAIPTPMDQGASEADVAITQNIREVIAATGKLSVNAKNIKIITLNGVVTLRGPVEDDQEKAYIASVAKSVVGVSTVDNQLEVAGSTSH